MTIRGPIYYNGPIERSYKTMEEKETKSSRAQLEATKRYQAKFYRVRFHCALDMKADIDAYCERHGITVTEFLRRAVTAQLQKEE